MLKKFIAKQINRALNPFGAKIIPLDPRTDFEMDAMLHRLSGRKIEISTIVDIGASDGKWSVSCMQHFPATDYLAIEPLKEREPALISNKAKFSNFDYALCVAGDADFDKVNLEISADLDGSTVTAGSSGNSRICETRTIDSLVSEKNLNGPYLLKFDTHGFELPILEGSQSTLEHTTAIIMEVYNFNLTTSSLRFQDMCTFLENTGFRCADIAEPMLRVRDNAFWQCDLLFLRNDAEMFKHNSYL